MAKPKRRKRRIVVAVLGQRITTAERRSIARELRTGTRKPPRPSARKQSVMLRNSPKGDPYGR